MPSERDLIQDIQSSFTRLVQAVTDADFWHDRWLEQAEEEHQQRISAAEAGYHQAIAEAQSAYERQLHRGTHQHERRVTEVEAHYQQVVSKAQGDYESVIPGVIEDAKTLYQSTGLPAASWDDPTWESWATAAEAGPSALSQNRS